MRSSEEMGDRDLQQRQRRPRNGSSHGDIHPSFVPSAIIRPYGYTESECGYCKGARSHFLQKSTSASSKSYSLSTDSMSPTLYEGFVYRGWRRSGIHLYKPCNFESCCPTLTIRLPTARFVPSKSQLKLLRRMNHLVLGDAIQNVDAIRNNSFSNRNKAEWSTNALEQTVMRSGILNALEAITNRTLLQVLSPDVLSELQCQKPDKEWKSHYRLLQTSRQDRKRSRTKASCFVCAQLGGIINAVSTEELVVEVVKSIQNDTQFQTINTRGGSVHVAWIDAHPQSGQIRCAIQLDDTCMSTSNHWSSVAESSSKRTRVEAASSDKPIVQQEPDKLSKWYQETTGKKLDNQMRRIDIMTMPAHQSALNPEVHQLYVHYQNVVHNDPHPFLREKEKEHGVDKADDATINTASITDGQRNLEDEEVLTSPADLDWGNAPDYFKDCIAGVLTKYLQTVPEKHRNVVLENFYSFYQFLVEAPFPFSHQQQQMHPPIAATDVPKTKPKGLPRVDAGLYHQHYRLGDMLIAVGVVDILPSGLSSVYLFYHPEFSHQLVALGKYAILKEIEYARDSLKLPYYYLGYYIESCQKMRYKSEYKPSELLCPKYYQWVNAPEAVAKLQQTPRHVCPLVSVDNKDTDEAFKKRKDALALHQVQMDIGAGINVTIDMLQPSGVEVVKPILEDLVAEAGPDLSVQCIVKLS